MLTRKIAEQLKDGTGIIWGIDSSPAMIETARHHVSDGPVSHHRHGYSVIDATKLFDYLQCTDLTALNRHELGIVDSLQPVEERYTKIFSNAALHWFVPAVPPLPFLVSTLPLLLSGHYRILRNSTTRENVFMAIFSLLAPGGHLVFEMGGHGNVSELHTALLSATAHRVGIDAARAADPWFFADEAWIRDMLVKTGFLNLDLETEYRPTRATARGENGGGGIEGWVRLMGQTFLEVVREEEREDVVKEVCDVLKTVCTTERAEEWIGYVRLRVKAMKPSATMGEGVRDEEGQEFE